MEVTLHDVLTLLTDQIDDVKEDVRKIAAYQEALVEATNHKIDMLRKQFIGLLATALAIALPIIIRDWDTLIERGTKFF